MRDSVTQSFITRKSAQMSSVASVWSFFSLRMKDLYLNTGKMLPFFKEETTSNI